MGELNEKMFKFEIVAHMQRNGSVIYEWKWHDRHVNVIWLKCYKASSPYGLQWLNAKKTAASHVYKILK